ncbi:MAG: pyrroline-5-carboxylate reductase [Peptococcaceae bacterium]|nr:pyrroline-5-carboxylate reductase [Peptococcaceae bacterium]
MYKIGFIGAGAMAEAIVTGLLANHLCSADEIIMSNRSQEKLKLLADAKGIIAAKDNQEVLQTAEVIVLAVKPQQYQEIKSKLAGLLKEKQAVVSIMAGITLADLQECFGDLPIFRAMPNTPAKIGCGMTGLADNGLATKEQKNFVASIFSSVGQVLEIAESNMDALGALSGSGPAYCYELLEAMADGGVMLGLPRAAAYQLAAQTMLGSAQMLLQTGEHPGVLKDQVTSPGGTTIRGLKVMEKAGVRGIMMETIEQAYLQTKQLGAKK